jgi:hypothetical protein
MAAGESPPSSQQARPALVRGKARTLGRVRER